MKIDATKAERDLHLREADRHNREASRLTAEIVQAELQQQIQSPPTFKEHIERLREGKERLRGSYQTAQIWLIVWEIDRLVKEDGLQVLDAIYRVAEDAELDSEDYVRKLYYDNRHSVPDNPFLGT